MKKSFVLIAAILAVIGLATAVAVANETTKVETTSVHDPRGDTRCLHEGGRPPKPCSAASKRDADIVRATAGHEGGRLRHTIRVVGEFRHGWLYINTDSDPDCERQMILGIHGRHAGVRDCGGPGPAVVHGRARVDHHLHSVEIFFRKRQLGNPDGYGWNAFTNVYTGTGTWAAHPSDIVRKWGRYIHQPLG